MAFIRRPSPHPPAPVRAGLFIGALLLLASAQAQALDALGAADPDRASALARPFALPPDSPAHTAPLPTSLEAARESWQRANARVAEFPRGHIDLLRRESHAGPDETPDAGTAGPPLDMAQALKRSLQHRPALFARVDMNALERAQLQTAYAAHVREVQRAWIQAVATRQHARLLDEAHANARTGSELGRRMVAAGNWSEARQLRERVIEAQAWQASADARGASLAALERLAVAIGVWDVAAVERLGQALPTQLPALPAQLSAGDGMEAAALRGDATLALSALQAERDMAAPSAARRQAWDTAVHAALDAAPALQRQPPQIDDLSLLRDPSLARAVAAEAALLQRATERRAMARQAWVSLQQRHASAVHAQAVVVPLHTALEQETQLRYNGMLQSTWELLASARERLSAQEAALQAQRDFWLAQADWQALRAGAPATSADATTPSTAPATAAPAGH